MINTDFEYVKLILIKLSRTSSGFALAIYDFATEVVD